MAKQFVAVIDAGTTNIKLLVFDSDCTVVDQFTSSVPKSHPQTGWVEQNPTEIVDAVRTMLNQAFAKHSITAVGITNQRETTVLWDKRDGVALYPAIVWEDNRTKAACDEMARDDTLAQTIRTTTGLLISPYFSATKIQWLMQYAKGRGYSMSNLAIGTIDSWLIYQLTGEHVTDYTNASRTMLFNIHTLSWDENLLNYFEIPQSLLPKPLPSKSYFGVSNFYDVPIYAVMGDQQASLYAAGTTPGLVKITYGTGIFPMKLIGTSFKLKDGFITTLAVGHDTQPLYAYEAKIDNASAQTSQVLDKPTELDKVVRRLAIQTAPLVAQLIDSKTQYIAVDGGISQNDTLLATQSKLNHLPMKRLSIYEGTALGVAKLLFAQN